MAEILDENRIPVAKGISSTDGSTIVNICADETLHALCVDDSLTGSDVGPTNDKRNENRKVAFMAVSAVDGVTPVPIYADAATGKLLIRTL